VFAAQDAFVVNAVQVNALYACLQKISSVWYAETTLARARTATARNMTLSREGVMCGVVCACVEVLCYEDETFFDTTLDTTCIRPLVPQSRRVFRGDASCLRLSFLPCRTSLRASVLSQTSVMSAPAGSDDEPDPETVFAALPPPDAFQKDAGWSRDWSRVWAPHEEKLAATRHLQGEALMDAFRSRPDHVSPNGTGRVLFFDVTGGPLVRLAKERARCEQIACETKAARVARDVAEQERKRREDVPDVVRVANMPTAVLQNGDTVPLLGLGTWKSTEPGEARRSVEHALKVGYTHIDCASVYENEKEVGDGMNHVFRTTRLNRKDVFVTSKLWNDKVRHAFPKSRLPVLPRLVTVCPYIAQYMTDTFLAKRQSTTRTKSKPRAA
jgi:hypothetical protein